MLNTSPKIKLHFELPSAGWLPTKLLASEQEFQFRISYTPNSALEEMVAFASAAAQPPFLGHCMWFGEPDELHFYTESHAHQTRFRLEYIDSDNTKTILLELDTPLQTLSLAIWRALRDLESRWESPVHDLEWKSPFPARDLLQLGKILGK